MINKKDLSAYYTFRYYLWPMMSNFKIYLIISIISLIVNAASDTFILSLIKPLLDNGFDKSDDNIFIWMPIAIISLMVIKGISSFISNYCISCISGKVVMNVRRRLFNHIMNMPVSFFDEHSTGVLLSKITYDSEQVALSSSGVLITIVREGALIIGLFLIMFYYSWQLSIILVLIIPIISIIIQKVSKKFRKISKKIQNTMGQISSSTEEMLKGHKEVLIFGGNKLENEKFNNISNNIRKQNVKMVAVSSALDPIIQLIASFAISLVIYISSFPSIMKNLTSGTIAVIFSSTVALMRPIKSLTNVNTLFQRGIAACQTLFSILNLDTEKDNGVIEIKKAKGEIIFENVTFFYPNKEIPSLKNINLTIPEGKTVALVGRSGSGKSTIVNLLVRLYNVQQGRILLDGNDIRFYKLASLRNQIAIVSQNIYLFNDTIANNIAYSCNEIYSRKQVERAAYMACAMDFIDKMKDGLDTVIGENGVLLSVGQKQRIAIARALLRNCPILVLDEATSSLDSKSEMSIQKMLYNLQKSHTLLIISHRFSIIRKAYKIFVVENGEIVEYGNHEELILHKGIYYHLYQLQFS